MARLLPLTLNEGNDETVALTVDAPVTLTLSACTFELFIKATADTADSSATKLTVGAGITIDTTAATARSIDLTAIVPAAALATPGKRFWRLDLLVSSARHTALYGPLTIRNL
ncbi:MAG: hypothetical protein JWN52_3581 [Actinomycetia bacterium]|nr:hypothetical protein [Actinomycetes bacterium]